MLPLSTNIHSANNGMVLMFTGRFPLSKINVLSVSATRLPGDCEDLR